MRAEVTLVNNQTLGTLTGEFEGEARHECVAKAFKNLVGRPQHDVLDEWKVLDATVLQPKT